MKTSGEFFFLLTDSLYDSFFLAILQNFRTLRFDEEIPKFRRLQMSLKNVLKNVKVSKFVSLLDLEDLNLVLCNNPLNTRRTILSRRFVEYFPTSSSQTKNRNSRRFPKFYQRSKFDRESCSKCRVLVAKRLQW